MSIVGDIGFMPRNDVRLTGRVEKVSPIRTPAFGGAYISFDLFVPRLSHGGDRIMCYALNEEAEQVEQFVRPDAIVTVDGELRINPKKRTWGVLIVEWWIEDEEPQTEEEREAERARLRDLIERHRLAIGALIPPPEMSWHEQTAWTLATFHGADWEERWKEAYHIDADKDERIARVYAVLQGHWKKQDEAGRDGDRGD